MKEKIIENSKVLFEEINSLSLDDKIETINKLKQMLHEQSPFKNEPVDCVIWVKNDKVKANGYNPNSVNLTEMELLRHSIREDGYTQPIVGFSKDEDIEVVDGFHRNRVGKECDDIKERIHGYLPLVVINSGRTGLGDRMASTIRHNRARGKHMIDAMSDIVVELSRRKWNDEKIAKELGMDADEVLRLKQITGLASMFEDKEFSKAWDIEITED